MAWPWQRGKICFAMKEDVDVPQISVLNFMFDKGPLGVFIKRCCPCSAANFDVSELNRKLLLRD